MEVIRAALIRSWVVLLRVGMYVDHIIDMIDDHVTQNMIPAARRVQSETVRCGGGIGLRTF